MQTGSTPSDVALQVVEEIQGRIEFFPLGLKPLLAVRRLPQRQKRWATQKQRASPDLQALILSILK